METPLKAFPAERRSPEESIVRKNALFGRWKSSSHAFLTQRQRELNGLLTCGELLFDLYLYPPSSGKGQQHSLTGRMEKQQQ